MATEKPIGKLAVGKKTCPTCHQVINSRVLRLRKAHVTAITKSIRYLAEHKVNKLNIRDIDYALTKTEYANFNEVKRLLPQAVWGEPGEYNFDLLQVMDFLTGGEVVIELLIRPDDQSATPTKRGTINDIKGANDFIKDHKWITEYRKPQIELNQLGLV